MNWKNYFLTSWQGASRREKHSMLTALAVLALALLWWVALAPALAVWRTSPAQHLLIQSQMQRMLALQVQAHTLQAQPTLNASDARQALEESLVTLGSTAQMNVQADRLTVTLQGVSADALAQWLSRSRQNAHLVPSEVHIASVGALWSGSFLFSLPIQ